MRERKGNGAHEVRARRTKALIVRETWLFIGHHEQNELELMKATAEATELALIAIESTGTWLIPFFPTNEDKEAGAKALAEISRARANLEKASDAFIKYLALVDALTPDRNKPWC